MRIRNNYKVAIAFTVLPFVITKFYGDNSIIKAVFWTVSVLCIFFPAFGNLIHNVFSKIGKFLGVWIAKIILFFTWFFAVLPTGCLMKIMNRDRLRLKKQNVKSYWIDNTVQNTEYEYQF